MKAADVRTLSESPIFACLRPIELAGALSRVPQSIRAYNRGRLIRLQGERCEDLLVVLEGRVIGELHGGDHRVMNVETISAVEAIASPILFSSAQRLPVSVRAETDVRLWRLPRASMLRLCSEYPCVLEGLLRDIGDRAAFLADRLRESQFETIRQRLAHYLLSRTDHSCNRFTMSESKKRLAERIGVARPSLFRVFGELEHEGAIHVDHKTIAVNRDLLSRIVSQD